MPAAVLAGMVRVVVNGPEVVPAAIWMFPANVPIETPLLFTPGDVFSVMFTLTEPFAVPGPALDIVNAAGIDWPVLTIAGSASVELAVKSERFTGVSRNA